MNVLIVEDDTIKYGKMNAALEAAGFETSSTMLAVCARDAVRALADTRFDVMLLDINLPRRLGEDPVRGGGLEVLRELSRDETLIKPRYIIGITAFSDAIQEFGEAFSDQLWSVVHYNESSDLWISQVRAKFAYIQSAEQSRQFSDGVTFGVDIAFVCALDTVELDAVRDLPFGWQPLRLPHDDTRYFLGSVNRDDRNYTVVAAAAPRMGMTASAVVAAKILHQFRPKVVSLVGICAGRFGKVEIGDVILADPTWDYGAGKIMSERNQPQFMPSPHQISASAEVVSEAKELAEDRDLLYRVHKHAPGRHPSREPRVLIGPVACGASVVADANTFKNLLSQHRGVLGLEMESYGVAGAVLGSGRPQAVYFCAKAVCDFADKDKEDDYQEYAAHVSARVSAELAVRILLKNRSGR